MKKTMKKTIATILMMFTLTAAVFADVTEKPDETTTTTTTTTAITVTVAEDKTNETEAEAKYEELSKQLKASKAKAEEAIKRVEALRKSKTK